MASAKAAALFPVVRTVAPELSVTVTMPAEALAVRRALVAQSPRVMLVVLIFMMVLSVRSVRFSVLSYVLAEVSTSSRQPSGVTVSQRTYWDPP
jgi:hypothetical protein